MMKGTLLAIGLTVLLLAAMINVPAVTASDMSEGIATATGGERIATADREQLHPYRMVNMVLSAPTWVSAC